jgi:NADPH2:quinone reductase
MPVQAASGNFATVGTPEKAEIARQRGADAAILYREIDFREEVMRLTSGQGVDVVYDSVGRALLGACAA